MSMASFLIHQLYIETTSFWHLKFNMFICIVKGFFHYGKKTRKKCYISFQFQFLAQPNRPDEKARIVTTRGLVLSVFNPRMLGILNISRSIGMLFLQSDYKVPIKDDFDFFEKYKISF